MKSPPQSQWQWPSPREGGTVAVFCLTRCLTHLIAPASRSSCTIPAKLRLQCDCGWPGFYFDQWPKKTKKPYWDKSAILCMVLAFCQVPKISVFNNVALICLVTIDSLATWSELLGQPGVCKTWSVSPPSLNHIGHRVILLCHWIINLLLSGSFNDFLNNFTFDNFVQVGLRLLIALRLRERLWSWLTLTTDKKTADLY